MKVNPHTVIQVLSLIVIGYAIARLTHNIAWALLLIGLVALVSSTLVELSKPAAPVRQEKSLREVA